MGSASWSPLAHTSRQSLGEKDQGLSEWVGWGWVGGGRSGVGLAYPHVCARGRCGSVRPRGVYRQSGRCWSWRRGSRSGLAAWLLSRGVVATAAVDAALVAASVVGTTGVAAVVAAGVVVVVGGPVDGRRGVCRGVRKVIRGSPVYLRPSSAWKRWRDRRRVLAAWTQFAETPPVAALNRATTTVGLEPGWGIYPTEDAPPKIHRRTQARVCTLCCAAWH